MPTTRDNFFTEILKIFLNRSLFWKVGFVIGLCVLANFSLTFYILSQIQSLDRTALYFEKITDWIFLVITIALFFLIGGAVAFWFMVKRPLNLIVYALDMMQYDPERIDLKAFDQILYRDEIGVLTEKFKGLFQNFQALQTYRHLIENDETVEDIYERLAEALKGIGFSSFVIYEVSNSQNTMRPVYKSDESLEINAEKLFYADKCRAKRTGKEVSSFDAPRVCKLYEYEGVTNYYCIPIVTGNKVLGVVEIHLPLTDETLKGKRFLEKIKLAKSFIEETAPVVESKRYAEALKEQTHKDPLTNLYNRRFLESILDNLTAQILRRGTTLGILMCDLDYFKSINDKYGHEAGDIVLKETAQILANNVRKSDLVVRFGGEEFLILLLDIREGEGERVAEKLRRAIELHEFKTPKGIVRRTISIGVSEFPGDSSSIWEAIKFADIALYKAKEGGRNRVVKFIREFWTEEEY